MNLKNLHTEFSDSELFPKELCTIKNLKEDDICESDNWFVCLIIDRRFDNERQIKIMKPYIWKSKESDETGFAWLDRSGNYIDNFYNPVHGYCDDEFVVGYAKYDKTNDDTDYWNYITSVYNQDCE